MGRPIRSPRFIGASRWLGSRPPLPNAPKRSPEDYLKASPLTKKNPRVENNATHRAKCCDPNEATPFVLDCVGRWLAAMATTPAPPDRVTPNGLSAQGMTP